MPYSREHKKQTRARITESARVLFNRHGFGNVSIDMVMENAGLTRGGFYNHFESKEALYSEAVSSFLMGRGAEWRAQAGVDPEKPSASNAQRMIEGYLSDAHLRDVDSQCPMIALPSDIARAEPEVQSSYQRLLEAMVSVFEGSGNDEKYTTRQEALSLAALCVGGMVLARTLPNSALADEVRRAAHFTASQITSRNKDH
jgi:TetR/AcrR family transcriptional repressor of nem operon